LKTGEEKEISTALPFFSPSEQRLTRRTKKGPGEFFSRALFQQVSSLVQKAKLPYLPAMPTRRFAPCGPKV